MSEAPLYLVKADDGLDASEALERQPQPASHTPCHQATWIVWQVGKVMGAWVFDRCLTD